MKTAAVNSETKPLSLKLYTLYEGDILRSRKAFLDYMEKIYGEEVAGKVRKMLNQRIEFSKSPLLGEMWPWFLERVFVVRSERGTLGFGTTLNELREPRLMKLVIQWYALYLAIVHVDDSVDLSIRTDFEILLPLIAEAGPLIADTEFARKSVIGQLSDMRKKPNANKNAFMGILVEKVAELSNHRDEKLEKGISGIEMMSLFQILDDIGDVDEDLRHRHPSFIINQKMARSGHDSFAALLTDDEFASGAVINSLIAVKYEAVMLQDLLEKHSKKAGIDLEMEVHYFESVADELNSLTNFIRLAVGEKDFPVRELKIRMEEVSSST